MKGSIVAASAALVATAAASAHNKHGAFHLRRNPAADVCTVYTTVYVYPSGVPAVPGYPEAPVVPEVPVVNSTVIVHPTPIQTPPAQEYPAETPSPSTSCTESETPSPAPEQPKETSPPAEYPAQPPAESTPPKDTAPPAEYPAQPPAAPSKPAEEYTPAPPAYTPEQPKPKPTSAKVQPKPQPTKVPSTPSQPYDNTGRIVKNGNKWAMTYTPYTAEGECRPLAQVKQDIANIAKLGFTTIRSYSTDCGVFENVVPECQKHGIKVIYGIFMEGGGAKGKGPFSEYANQQLRDIIKGSPKDSVAMIIVGNEALFNNYCTAGELASYIQYVKKELAKAGFPSDIAVTTTEPVGTWEEKGAALCDVIDVFAVQIHPYFTASVSADQAGAFAKQQLAQAAAVCPGAAAKGKYITEIGWPKSGNANGKAVPGVAQQKIAFKSIMKEVGAESCLFSYQDDYWKAPGPYGVEQSFGCSEALA